MELNILETTWKGRRSAQAESVRDFITDPEVENKVVNLHPSVQYQTFRGFGGTFTEAACYVMKMAGEAVTKEILEAYYGEGGLKYNQGRLHLDSADAGLGNYSAMNNPSDVELETFSLARDEGYVIPIVQAAQKIASQPLELMISPWSPPPFMKTNGQKNHGGKLKPEYRALWAKYMCRFIKEYEKRGIRFSMLSLQNEPKAVQIWDSCVYTGAEEREMLRAYLVPEMRRQGLQDIDVLIWDHNKERALERAEEVIADDEMREMVAGVAVHWYSGDHFEELEMVRRRFPEKRLVFSECCVEYSKYREPDELRSARMYAHEIIGDLNAGVDAFIHWSLVFDLTGGPNHVNNLCEAVVFCDWENKRVTYTLPYFYIGHFSRFIKPGAVRIGFSRFTEKLDVTAFMNPDGERVAVVVNKTSEDIPFVLREGKDTCRLIAKGDGIMTLRYRP
jgi:glucosylceramidase